MSYPYPQARHRDRKEKGEQPYKDAKETLRQEQATLADQEAGRQPGPGDETPEERAARVEAEMTERLRQVGEEVAARREQDQAGG